MKDNFEQERAENIRKLGKRKEIKEASVRWIEDVSKFKYSYNFNWLGMPIIQFPQDIVAIQEIVWMVKPDLVIETGIARGGSVVFLASILEMIGRGKVLGIDIEIRPQNRLAIEKHPMSKRIKMIEGSSLDKETISQVEKVVKGKKKVLVILDSNHTHEHVIEELNNYSRFVSKGSYLIVLDTIIEDMSENFFKDRQWGKGDNPKTAVHEFLKTNHRFQIDKDVENKLMVTVAPDGYLKCIKD